MNDTLLMCGNCVHFKNPTTQLYSICDYVDNIVNRDYCCDEFQLCGMPILEKEQGNEE